MQLGDMVLYPMQDGTVSMPLSKVLGESVRDEVAAAPEHYARFLDDAGCLPFSYGCTLAEGSGRHVLLDTSLGHVDPPDTTPSRDVRDLLKACAGITRHDIDAVTLSHGHPDHVAGSVMLADDGELVPMYPNATHYMQRAEYEFASGPMREAWKFDTYLGAVEAAGLLRIIDGEHQVTPEILLIDGFAGHTPGLQAARLQSGEAIAYYIGDALHQTIQFAKPEWSPVFDWKPELGAASRRKLLGLISQENALLLSPHLPFPGVGKVEPALAEGAWEFAPIAIDLPQPRKL